eukprot:m.108993 g.108993  ORF g.108993 m.108993 type:complete len:468 (+) comp13360_c1_seq1:375-1778(+)
MDDVYVIHATSSEDEEGTVDVVDHHDGETVILLDNSDSDSDSSHSPFHGHTGKRSSTTEQNQKAKQQVKEHDTDASGDGSSADDDEDDVEEVLPLTKEEEEEEEEFISLAEPGARDGDGRPLKHAKVKVDSLEQHRTAQDFFLAPWLRDQYSEQPIIALHQEIEDFYQWVQPREYEAEIRKAIILQVEQVVLSLWPHAQVDVFGSFRTGLYLPTSDIDLVVFGEWVVPPLRTLARALREHGLAEDIDVIDKARVPILKFCHPSTSIKLDISFNQGTGVTDSDLVKKWSQEYIGLPQLLFVIKQFLFQRSLSEPFHGGIGSFATFLLVMSYLQRRVIKPVQKPNLGVMLIEFFELYGHNFDFKTVGISVRKKGTYFKKRSRGFVSHRQLEMICIENPTIPSLDVTSNSFATPKIKEVFGNAFKSLCCLTHERKDPQWKQPASLLSLVITMDPEVVEGRDELAHVFSAE